LKVQLEGAFMRENLWRMLLIWLVLLFVSGTTLAQASRQSRTLIVNGQAGQAELVKIDGHFYVDLDVLARITNGSVRFKASRIFLDLPLSSVSAPATIVPQNPADDSGLSRDFMRAGIETIAGMREWASTMAYAIQNGYQVTESWASNYREQAAHNLSLASAAATTEGDRSALQLLTNEFDAVRDWSNKLVEAKRSMDTGKYAVSPNALRDEPLSQKIIACGRFLAPMLGSGTLQDDASCH
jgi:hypothetical protein